MNKRKSQSSRRKNFCEGKKSGLLYRSLLFLVRVLIFPIFRVQVEIDERIHQTEGGILFLSNHQGYLDPAFIAGAIPKKCFHFVVAEFVYRAPFLRFFTRRLHAIPKRQFNADPASVLAMLRCLRNGGNLLLFPEGQRSLDGSPLPLQSGSARLAKKGEAAIAVACLKGSHFSWPRWSEGFFRPGLVTVDIRVLFSADEVQALSTEQIDRAISDALAINEYDWQSAEEPRQNYRSKATARGLEKLLHLCPNCESLFGMQTDGSRLFCRYCGFSLRLRPDYSFVRTDAAEDSQGLPFETIAAWHHWQMGYEKESYQTACSEDKIWLDTEVRILRKSYSQRRARDEKGEGRLFVDARGCHVEGEVGGDELNLFFPWEGGRIANAAYGHFLEFYHEERRYLFFCHEPMLATRIADLYLALI